MIRCLLRCKSVLLTSRSIEYVKIYALFEEREEVIKHLSGFTFLVYLERCSSSTVVSGRTTEDRLEEQEDKQENRVSREINNFNFVGVVGKGQKVY